MAPQQVMIDPDHPPLVDIGHPGIRFDLEAFLYTGKFPLPAGEVGLVTIRQGNTTLTIPLDKDGLRSWIARLEELDATMSGSGLVIAGRPGIIPAVAVPGP